MTDEEIEEMGGESDLRPAPCNYDPQPLLGLPIGQFHCPLCGEMVIAGLKHPEPDPYNHLNQEKI